MKSADIKRFFMAAAAAGAGVLGAFALIRWGLDSRNDTINKLAEYVHGAADS